MPYSEETASYKFNHTMLRIKDPNVSIPFYTDIIGMDFIEKLEFSDFTLYFLAFDQSGGKATEAEKKAGRHKREGVPPISPNFPSTTAPSYDCISHYCYSSHHSGILELTHNHGTETLDKTPFHSGNSEPRGFGHIAITVDDVEAACARFERLGVPFQKRLTDGKIKSIAFILDPDGYWIEVFREKDSKSEEKYSYLDRSNVNLRE
ncbi:glyoxalase I [Russula emetica]|nr:glyoxalase I [Russula emetica]